jgi:lipopolysaccharide export system protein LptC
MNHQPTASTLGKLAASGFVAQEVRNNERIFRRAARHSRYVRFMRWAIPAGLVLLVAAITLASYLDPLRLLTRLPIESAGMVVSGTRITMASPKLAGFTRDGRKYDVVARAATQDLTKPDLMELEDIRAKFTTQDQTALDLTASEGLYDRKTTILTLRRNIVLVSSAGYEVRLSEVRVDTGTGDIVSERPVEVTMEECNLKANRLEVTKGGEVMYFEGNVKMVINAEHAPSQGEQKR